MNRENRVRGKNEQKVTLTMRVQRALISGVDSNLYFNEIELLLAFEHAYIEPKLF
jgi:hypothetical protein